MTVEEQLAKVMADNEELKKQAAAQAAAKKKAAPNHDGDAPGSIEVGLQLDGKSAMSGSVSHRTFTSGSRGYHMFGKVRIAGNNYQVNVQLIEIGSKPPRQ